MDFENVAFLMVFLGKKTSRVERNVYILWLRNLLLIPHRTHQTIYVIPYSYTTEYWLGIRGITIARRR